jgi:hypothetical protein
MIIIGGGFSEQNLKKIAEKVSRPHTRVDVNKFERMAREIFSKLGVRKEKESPQVKAEILTPEQRAEAEILRKRVQEILNRPLAIKKFY